ncbi:MAG: hypothetical protein ACRDSP_17895 [Pseudonocardiaceae bacterium]
MVALKGLGTGGVVPLTPQDKNGGFNTDLSSYRFDRFTSLHSSDYSRLAAGAPPDLP